MRAPSVCPIKGPRAAAYRFSEVARKSNAVEAESLGQDRCRDIEFREALDIGGPQQFRKAESILRGGAQNVLFHEATNLAHLYAQDGCRFSIIEKAFCGRSDAWHRPILTE